MHGAGHLAELGQQAVTTVSRSEMVGAHYRVEVHESNPDSHTGLMAWDKTPWPPPLVELAGGMAGHLLAWERHERDGSWWAWVSWMQEAGGRRDHKVVLVR